MNTSSRIKGTGFGFGGLSTSSTTLSYIAPPPDVNNVPAEIRVAFKNLLKKDSITKTKALDDIIAYVKASDRNDGAIEDSVLDAWCQLYARVSIDNSRRVRELSHTVLLELLRSAKKRMETRLLSLIGAWLAGSFDREKAVSRAANDGFSSLCDTEDKRTKVWNRAQTKIMDYATEAIRETPRSLSDERFTTEEDIEAKYYRVVASSLSLVLNLMEKTDLGKLHDRLTEYLSINTVWDMAAAEDSFVRRSLYQLLTACLAATPELVKPQLPQIGKVLMTKSLKDNQTGSALDLVKVLTILTRTFPEIWGTKKHPLELLRSFVEKGSQGSSWAYWTELRNLLSILLENAPSPEVAAKFLESLRKGVSHREEPKANNPYAWSCYLTTFEKVIARFPPDSAFLQANFFPLTRQFLDPTPELSEWNSVLAVQFLPKAWGVVASYTDANVRKAFDEEWRKLVDSIILKLDTSSPAVSKDHQKSQQAIAEVGDRWFTLAAAILRDSRQQGDQGNDDSREHLATVVSSSSVKIIEAAQGLLLKRSFKPFGAASLLQSAFKKCPGLDADGSLVASLFTDREEKCDYELLVTSPSLPYLVFCLDKLSSLQRGRFETVWNELIEVACNLQDTTVSQSAVLSLISIPSAVTPARRQDNLQRYLRSAMLDCALGKDSSSWQLFDTAISSAVLTEDSLKSLVSTVINIIAKPVDAAPALRAIELIAMKRPNLLTQDEEVRMQLVTSLLAVTELSGQSLSEKITSIRALLDSQPSSSGARVLQNLIQNNLDDAEASSLDIETLIQEASTLSSDSLQPQELLPNTTVWARELMRFLIDVPDPSLVLASRLGGAYFLVKKDTGASSSQPKRDRQGRSIPARMALYSAKMLSSVVKLSSLPTPAQVEVLRFLCLTVELAEDQMVSTVKDGLWKNIDRKELITEVQELVTRSRQIISGIAEDITEVGDWREAELDGDSLIPRLITATLGRIDNFSPSALYSAKALSNLLETLAEKHGAPAKLEAWLETLGFVKPTPSNTFAAIAFLTGFREMLAQSKYVNRLCNQLVSNMLGALPLLQRTLQQVVLLNACMSVYESESGKLPVESRKQVLAFKQIISWTDTPDETGPGLAAESCKAVYNTFPAVKAMYGEIWERLITYCITLWNNIARDSQIPGEPYSGTAYLPYLYSSIKLMSALEDEPDANEDLIEALAECAKAKSQALIGLLKLPRSIHNVDLLLCRAVEKVPLAHIGDLSELYRLVASHSRAIQTAAFGLLHRAIPAAQENIAMNSILNKTTEKLPEELLLLLSDAPSLESYPEELLVQFPAAIRSYLLGWHLVFDAYSKAPQKLQGDYTDCIKSQNIITPLLDFTFDVLGHSAAHALNLTKEGLTPDRIRSYNIKYADGEEDEKNMHWLLVHLCYMTLKYLPGLFKAWYLDCRSKQTKIAVEDWTTRYLSWMLIEESLNDVAVWQSQQEPPEEDEKELNIKISKAAREVTAEYEVDEDVVSIAIRIPTGYPLESVEVVGLNRVAVDEKKWKNWLLTTQGVITFANGSIADGLAVFRRNIIGTMKGHTECAICYSIVATDKKLPDKKCDTCKHAFHRICLYKWFQNSGKNSCPLCRNPIDFLGKRK